VIRWGVLAIAIASSFAAPTAMASDGKGGVKLRSVGSFDSPVYVGAAPGAPNLLFIVERDGKIVVLRDGKRAGTFLDITERVSTAGERGLFSVAFEPNYESSGRFYVYYTDTSGDIQVDGYERSPDSAARADAGTRAPIITIDHPSATNHNGGTVAFGPDGNLYLATGDGGASSSTAQNRGSLLGKLLRIDPRPSSARGYSIPKGNPYRGDPGQAEIYSVGLRNPFRFSFDSRKPILAIGDVGDSSREEVDYLRVNEARGANFGWDVFEGGRHVGGNLKGKHEGPMFDYANDSDTCAVTGGVTVHDRRLKSLRGRYLFADVCEGELRSFKPRLKGNDARAERKLGVRVSQPVGFGEDGDGHVYVASLDGKVFRLAPK
jgi:glucose/arabinose dehydrogenase